MRTKPTPLGTVNACGRAVLMNSRGRVLGTCYDTPNALTVAFQKFPQAAKARGYWGNIYRRKEFVGQCLSAEQIAAMERTIIPF